MCAWSSWLWNTRKIEMSPNSKSLEVKQKMREEDKNHADLIIMNIALKGLRGRWRIHEACGISTWLSLGLGRMGVCSRGARRVRRNRVSRGRGIGRRWERRKRIKARFLARLFVVAVTIKYSLQWRQIKIHTIGCLGRNPARRVGGNEPSRKGV